MSKLGGSDVSIEISLKEYGFAWVEREEDFLFYYAVEWDGDVAVKFGCASVNKNEDFKEECYWVDWNGLYSYVGVMGEDWDFLPFPYKVKAIVDYEGYSSMFGSGYVAWFSYEEVLGREVGLWS